MNIEKMDIIAAGHICLDIIPSLGSDLTNAENLFSPGKLIRVGPATVALGGSVANTGIALHRLGAKTRLIGKVGDDPLGMTVLESLAQYDSHLGDGLIVAPGEATSYTLVFSPQGIDRSFLHCPGANDTFVATELEWSALADTRILHFGYPPLMREVIADGGARLLSVFKWIQRNGALVSLDMAMPYENNTSQQFEWREWLCRVLPCVDLFLPSFDEILLMLDPTLCKELSQSAHGENLAALVDSLVLERLADELIEMGALIVVFKLGDQGLYLQTSERTSQLLSVRARWQDYDWRAWNDLRTLCPCFDVDVVGTTGAGDCTIAGLLMALLRGCNPEQALCSATAVGALCVQSADATSNIPAWDTIEQIVNSPDRQREPAVGLSPSIVTLNKVVPPAALQHTKPTK